MFKKIKAPTEIILKSVIPQPVTSVEITELKAGNGVLTITGSKIYYCGGGWYNISGYAANGKDVYHVVDLINELMVRKALTKEGGYYFNKKGDICGVY